MASPAAVCLLLLAVATVAVTASDDKIYVHIVPHTHDDVGWLKTVDEYFYGANNSIQHAGVQYILDTVVDELQKNPNRTFIYVEMAFFVRWWNEQTDETKQIVRKLVTETRQLEFINAGWCMNDEAATDYNAIIDQMSIGLRFVEENFGPSARPRVGWHIDPFGHSSQMASIHSQLGMDGFFFARIDYDDKNQRLSDKTMEMVWQSSQSLGAAGDIFTGVLYYFYGPPPGFCFDVRCSDQPIQDDPKLFGYNVDGRVASFVKAAQEQAAHYASNHIMFTMGSDFNYENALEWYKNLDKLVHYVNKKMGDQVEVFYSTPSRYLDALNKLNLTWTTKTDDFFPYADNPHSFWTGYFTSRPALKGYTRVSNSLLQTCKQVEVLGESPTLHRHTQASSVTLAQAMGVDQHHDAVSGTEKQHVADDYARRLHVGQVECQKLINDVLMAFLTSSGTQSPSFEFCEYLNVSYCPVTETNSFNVMAYNPIGRTTVVVLGFPVTSDSIEVLDETGKPITAQLIPISEGTKKARGNRGEALYDLLFPGLLRPLGSDLFLVRPTKSGRGTSTVKSREYVPEPGADFTIDNGVMTLTFSGATGRLMMMENKVSKISAKVDQNFLWWNSSAGNNVNSTQTSGAYIFRPNGTAPFEINGSIAKTKVIDGPVFTAVIQEWAPWLYQTISLLKTPASPTAIFSYIVGPIPFQDGLGKEIISRFTTDLNTKSKFYTDSNGRQMLERVRNYRPTWKYNNTEPVTGNYYPVDSRIFIKDEDRGVQFTVMNDRAQGGSSLNDGQLELMVHRRTLYDDSRGVGEPLNETGQTGEGLIITGVHVAILDNFVNSTIYHRIIGEDLMLRPQYPITPSNLSYADWIGKYPSYSVGLTVDLPLNVHLLTLERLDHTHHLLRLEHQYPIDEAPLNTTANVTLEELFQEMKVVAVVELGLGGNALLSDIHRLHWNTASSRTRGGRRPTEKLSPPFTIELKPMEIRTFNITVTYY